MTAGGREPDAIDLKLMALLERDARRPATSLARAVGLSRSAVQDRLARLEDSGAIAGYTIRRGTAGPLPTRALMLLVIETRPCDAVLRRLKDWGEIRACYSVAGQIDAVLLVETASAASLGALRDRLAAVPGVMSVTTAPVLRTLVERPGSGGEWLELPAEEVP